MPYHATFDAAGLPTGYWQDGTAGAPDGAVSITDAQHEDLVLNAGLRRWNGTDVVAYAPPAPVPGPRMAPGAALVHVLDKATKVCPRDLAYVAGLCSVREDMASIVRIAAVDGRTVAAWFDAALAAS